MFPSRRDRDLAVGQPGRLSAALSRALAYVTLESYGAGAPAASEAVHPHRRPAELPRRNRRPGTVAARPQVCRAPLERPRTPRRAHAHR